MDPILDNQEPEEQHRFRAHYRLEEHLITADVVIDKLLGINTPIWIVSLDLSKAFDRINWDALWLSLRDRLGSAMHIFEPGGKGCRQFGLQSWFCYQCWGSWRVRAVSEAFHVCSSMGDGDLATTGYSFLILVSICMMACLSFWIWNLQMISFFLRPALMKQPLCLTYSCKIWQQQVCFLNAHKTVTLTNEA